jgi:hypothetical protein
MSRRGAAGIWRAARLLGLPAEDAADEQRVGVHEPRGEQNVRRLRRRRGRGVVEAAAVLAAAAACMHASMSIAAARWRVKASGSSSDQLT